jgi:hypothetical protein
MARVGFVRASSYSLRGASPPPRLRRSSPKRLRREGGPPPRLGRLSSRFALGLGVALSLLLWTPAAAAAQTLTIGTGISSACRGSEGSTCGQDHSAVANVTASIWLGERVEIQYRFGQGALPDRRFEVPRDGRFPPGAPDRVTVFLEDRALRYSTLSAIWHFLPGRRVRPLVGVGLGSSTVPRHRRCEPAGCDSLLTLLAGPERATPHSDVAFSAGLSVRATNRLSVRAGFTAHNPAAEGLSSTETGIGVVFKLF